MSNEYDRIIKENIEPILPSLAEKLFGIKFLRFEDVKDKIQATLEREPDYLGKALIAGFEQEEIVQFEFQSQNETHLAPRLLVYYALEFQKFKLPIRQFVIYIGLEPLRSIETAIEHPSLSFRFDIKDIREIPYDEFLSSDKPEEVILAILGSFKQENPEMIVEEILKRLLEVTNKKRILGKYVFQLRNLSRLRKLQAITISKIINMPIVFDLTQEEIEEDFFFKKGIEKGIEKKTHDLIIALIEQAVLSLKQIAQVADVSVEYVKEVQSKIKTK